MSEQDFNQNVVEVAYSIYLAAYWPIAQNVGTWLGGWNIHLSSLLVMSRQWWPTNPKDIFPVRLLHFVLVVNALVRKSSDLLECNQSHNAAMFSSKCETFALQMHYITSTQGGLRLPPLSLIFYKNIFVCARDINCFRIYFAC